MPNNKWQCSLLFISDMIRLKHIQGLFFIGKYIKFNTDGPTFCSYLLLNKIGGCIKFSPACSEKKHFYLMWQDYFKKWQLFK